MTAYLPSPPSNGFHLGPLFFHAYGLAYVVAVIAAVAITMRRPGIETGSDVGGVGDASGRENGIVVGHRATNARQQLRRRKRPANVAAGLDALSDHAVRPGRACRECLLDRATLVNPDLGGPPPRGAPKGDDHVGLRSRLEVPAASEWQEQVHRQRPVAQPAGRRDLSSQPAGIEDADRAQATGRRDRCGEPMSRKAAAHAALHNRHLHSQPLQQGAHALIIAAGVLQSRRAERSATVHIYGDQASVLVQLGLLDRSTLPVAGAEEAERLLELAGAPDA
jgi:hypothetical protein